MRIEGTRFGTIENYNGRVIHFDAGLIGFPQARDFIVLERDKTPGIAWLQSVDDPGLAFPISDAAEAAGYPALPARTRLAADAGFESDDVCVFIVVAKRGSANGLVANMLAPIVIHMPTGRGAQVVLDAQRYSASAPVNFGGGYAAQP